MRITNSLAIRERQVSAALATAIMGLVSTAASAGGPTVAPPRQIVGMSDATFPSTKAGHAVKPLGALASAGR
jgi:hypothetical protein